MFKRIATAALALALLMSSFVFSSSSAFAQRDTTAAPGVWLSAILIQNTSTASADVSINFYDKDGTLKKTYPVPNGLGAGKSVTIVVPSQVADLAAGQYSAVVSSTQKVIASVQTSSVTQATGPWTAFAYEGVDSSNAAKKLFFPANYNNYFGFFSELVIQNTSDTDSTTLTADFYKADGTKIKTVTLGTLVKNSAKTWAMSDALLGVPTGNADGIFGAVVTSSTTPVAGIANIWRTSPTNMTASYNGATAGTTSLFAPSLSNNYFGFASSLTLQNVDQVNSAAGTITYSNGQTESFSLTPNAAKAFYQPSNANLPAGNANGSFSAKVVATSGSVIGVVSYSAPPELSGGSVVGSFASYNCPAVASANVNLPNVLNNYFGYFTNVSVQNTGSVATDITLTYENNLTWKISNVQPNAVANFLHLPGLVGNPLAAGASVSAVASSSNAQPLVAVIQHNTEKSLAAYNAAKLPSDFLQVFTATPKL
jgi:hypothetical protein